MSNYYITDTIIQQMADKTKALTGSNNTLTPAGIKNSILNYDNTTRLKNTLASDSSTIKNTETLGFLFKGRKTDISSNLMYKCVKALIYDTIHTTQAITRTSFDNFSSLCKVYISDAYKITGTLATQSPFYQKPNIVLYTNAAEKPATWGTYFNYYSSSETIEVHYGVTEEEFITLVNS